MKTIELNQNWTSEEVFSQAHKLLDEGIYAFQFKCNSEIVLYVNCFDGNGGSSSGLLTAGKVIDENTHSSLWFEYTHKEENEGMFDKIDALTMSEKFKLMKLQLTPEEIKHCYDQFEYEAAEACDWN